VPGSFLFVTWNGGGNVSPLVELARRLITRGHRVRVLSTADLEARFEAEGVRLRARATPEAWGAAGEEKLALLRRFADEIIQEAQGEPTDALVVDFMQPEALCAAERSGLPYAAFVHTLHSGVAVSPFTPMAMAMDAATINQLRAGLQLAPVTQLPELLDHAATVLVTSTREFDGGTGPTTGNVRFTGPLVELAGPDASWRPPQQDAAAPLVVVGLGTTPMGEAPVLQRVLDGLGSLPVRVFATVGPHIDPATVRTPANASVSEYVRHAAVFPHAALFITHAGLSGISAALSFGVPMLCMPLGRDQPANAARVAGVGAGRVLSPSADASEIVAAVSQMLGDARYRTGASRVAEIIRDEGSGWRAVDELEAMLTRN
jgi:MGT family glycosyltransferase